MLANRERPPALRTPSSTTIFPGSGASGPFSGRPSSPAWPTSTRATSPPIFRAARKFGYMLIWVIVASNMMAMLIQTLSAKLGIATGRNLAEICRDRFPRPVVYAMWVLSEGVAIATDLAEFLGAALGFNLLFHMPLFIAGLLTGVATFLILGLERYGFRPLEAVITVLVGIIAGSYLIETFIGSPDWSAIWLPRSGAAVFRLRERAPRGRHPGRDRDATRHLPPLVADARAHRAQGSRPGKTNLPLRSHGRGDCHGRRGHGRTPPC